MKLKKSHPQAMRIGFHHDTAQAVFIAGTFNDWNPTATPLIAMGEGRWVKELALPPGRYEYRFVVDGEWVSNTEATEHVTNGFGTSNSVFVVETQP